MPAIFDKVERKAIQAASEGKAFRRTARAQASAYARWPLFEPAFWRSLTKAAEQPEEAARVKALVERMFEAGADESPTVLRNLESLLKLASESSRRARVLH
ncbi:hypothetical protein UB46_29235 [Burkholderiaceae bacterium 16]|nr:hypothetical protein UB46_29235 [Burkholderiaceae bacterium 16]